MTSGRSRRVRSVLAAGLGLCGLLFASCGAPRSRSAADATATLVVTQRIEGTGAFVPMRVSYDLDGRLLAERDVGSPVESGVAGIAEAPVSAGPHVLAVRVAYRLVGVGVFRYLDGRTGTATFSHELSVPPGERRGILAIVHERSSPAGPIESRVGVHFVERSEPSP